MGLRAPGCDACLCYFFLRGSGPKASCQSSRRRPGSALAFATPGALGKCNQRSRAQTAPRAPRGTRARARTAQTGQGRSSTRGRRVDVRGATRAKLQATGSPQGYPRHTRGVLTMRTTQLPPRLLVPPDPRQRDGRPVVALRRGVTHVILISLVMRHGASFMVQDRIQSAPTTKGPR